MRLMSRWDLPGSAPRAASIYTHHATVHASGGDSPSHLRRLGLLLLHRSPDLSPDRPVCRLCDDLFMSLGSRRALALHAQGPSFMLGAASTMRAALVPCSSPNLQRRRPTMLLHQ